MIIRRHKFLSKNLLFSIEKKKRKLKKKSKCMTYVHTFLNLTLRRNKQIIDYVYLTDEIQIFDVYIL